MLVVGWSGIQRPLRIFWQNESGRGVGITREQRLDLRGPL